MTVYGGCRDIFNERRVCRAHVLGRIENSLPFPGRFSGSCARLRGICSAGRPEVEFLRKNFRTPFAMPIIAVTTAANRNRSGD